MPRPYVLVDRVDTKEGPLELRRRGEDEFLVSIAGRVLMSSAIHRTEAEVAVLGCRRLASKPKARVLIGGLGLGHTLRAALDALGSDAEVVVAELNARVVDWCKGPVAKGIGNALDDRRVRVVVGDVMKVVRQAKDAPFDAIIVDLYEGPKALPFGTPDLLYGTRAIGSLYEALVDGGVYAVWSEEPYRPFESRLVSFGFTVERVRAGRGGPHHAVYVATKSGVPMRSQEPSRGASHAREPSDRRAGPEPKPGDRRPAGKPGDRRAGPAAKPGDRRPAAKPGDRGVTRAPSKAVRRTPRSGS